MNYIQKQAALQKLAQVRLAINYVMRNRGMKKQAEPGVPGYGYFADPKPGYLFAHEPAPYLPEVPLRPYIKSYNTDRFNTVGPDGNTDVTRWNWTWDGSEDELMTPDNKFRLANLKRLSPDWKKVQKFGPSKNNIKDFYKAQSTLSGQGNHKYNDLMSGNYLPASEYETPQERAKRVIRQGDFGF